MKYEEVRYFILSSSLRGIPQHQITIYNSDLFGHEFDRNL